MEIYSDADMETKETVAENAVVLRFVSTINEKIGVCIVEAVPSAYMGGKGIDALSVEGAQFATTRGDEINAQSVVDHRYANMAVNDISAKIAEVLKYVAMVG